MVVIVAVAVVPILPAMFIPALVPILPTMIIPALVAAFIPAITMMLLVTRNVLVVIPVVLHEVDPLAAGVVFAAVFAPVFRVARGHMQIDRRAVNQYPLDYNRLPVDKLRLRIIADVEAAIETGLADA